MEKIRNIVYNARKTIGLSQNALGEATGVWGTYISQIEKGTRLPSDEVLGLLSKVLNLDLELVMVTVYYERADTPVAKVLFRKIYRNLTQSETDINLAKLTTAQRDAIADLYGHWQNPNHTTLSAETLKRLTSLPGDKAATVAEIVKAFDDT